MRPGTHRPWTRDADGTWRCGAWTVRRTSGGNWELREAGTFKYGGLRHTLRAAKAEAERRMG